MNKQDKNKCKKKVNKKSSIIYNYFTLKKEALTPSIRRW